MGPRPTMILGNDQPFLKGQKETPGRSLTSVRIRSPWCLPPFFAGLAHVFFCCPTDVCHLPSACWRPMHESSWHLWKSRNPSQFCFWNLGTYSLNVTRRVSSCESSGQLFWRGGRARKRNPDFFRSGRESNGVPPNL